MVIPYNLTVKMDFLIQEGKTNKALSWAKTGKKVVEYYSNPEFKDYH